MPEGCEVARMGDHLKKYIEGKNIGNIEFIMGIYKKIRFLEGEDLLCRLENGLVKKVFTHGKKVIWKIDCSTTIYYLVNQPLMGGNWFACEGEIKLPKQARVLFTFNDQGKVSQCVYTDTRFGLFSVFNQKSYDSYISQFGPDMLKEDIDIEVFKNCLMKGKNQEICKALLDQHFISGIGNWIRSSVLYESKIYPAKKVKELSNEEWSILLYYTKKVMKDGYEGHGHSFQNYIDAEHGRDGYEPVIYGKSIDHLGNEVKVSKFSDGRTMYWVPAIQKL